MKENENDVLLLREKIDKLQTENQLLVEKLETLTKEQTTWNAGTILGQFNIIKSINIFIHFFELSFSFT